MLQNWRKYYVTGTNCCKLCGGGQMVSVLGFYSNDPSLNPSEGLL